MTEPTGSPTPLPADEEPPVDLSDPRAIAWFQQHEADLRRHASGQWFLYWSPAIAFAVGLAAHVAGYLLRSTAPAEPLGLLADLLYALGFALWTGVVVAVFIQVAPEAKRQQIRRALDAYESLRRDRARRRGKGDFSAGSTG